MEVEVEVEVDAVPAIPVPAVIAEVEGGGGVDDVTISLIEGKGFLGLNLLVLASWRFQPATLMLPKSPQ